MKIFIYREYCYSKLLCVTLIVIQHQIFKQKFIEMKEKFDKTIVVFQTLLSVIGKQKKKKYIL